jgi:large subunit ribosomal protein L18
MTTTTDNRNRRRARIRAKVSGTGTRPRLSVYKSNARIYAQLIDDVAGVTLAAVSDDTMKGATKTDRAREAGKALAALASAKGIGAAVFDRGGYMYIGRVRAVAEGAREGGLAF